VGDYDRTRPLIIDPVLSYSTYLGGSGSEEGTGIAVDATGAVYVTGTTSSTDFPTVNAVQPARNGRGSDLFVAKLTPDGTALVYATYLGGSGGESGADIAVDSAGAAYVSAVTSSSDFPTVNAFQPESKGTDAVVAKLSADGSRLIYSTYLGGSGYESGNAIAVDLAGAAYIAGETESPDFPVVNALQPTPLGESGDAFVAKLAPDGSTLLYSTYLGSSQIDIAYDIAVDSLGAAYVVGSSEFGQGFPLVNPLQAPGGNPDAFVAKFAPDGTRLIYSTPLGGKYYDAGFGIAIDASGAAYVTGGTESPDFPTMNALQPQLGDEYADGFVVKIAPEGGAMIFGTYLGGSGREAGGGIAVDTAGAAYVTGRTSSSDFPTMNALQPALHGAGDAFVSKLSPDGASLVHSTYLGGREDDRSRSITVDLTGAAYVTGLTQSPNFPTVNALQPPFGAAVCSGASDAFVAKITEDNIASPAAGDSIADPPTTQSISSPRGGGGAMDAIFLVLLTQLAFAGALRRRSGPVR
jgi:hypothetical protein